MTPCIGVSMNYNLTDEGSQRAYLDSEYLDFLLDSGALPFPIAPTQNPDQLDAVLDHLDGILFTGGLDLDPSLWREKPHPKTKLLHARRQQFEFTLYEAVQKRRLPIMGICLGIQMINVAHGGSLYQHIGEFPGKIDHGQDGRSTEHKVTLDRGSRLFALLKTDNLTVPSCHHQGVNRLGDGLLAAAVAGDGVVEAVERVEYPFLMAVQWHPERDPGNPISRTILKEFLSAAKSFRTKVLQKSS